MKKKYITPSIKCQMAFCPTLLAGSTPDMPQKKLQFNDQYEADPDEEIL